MWFREFTLQQCARSFKQRTHYLLEFNWKGVGSFSGRKGGEPELKQGSRERNGGREELCRE